MYSVTVASLVEIASRLSIPRGGTDMLLIPQFAASLTEKRRDAVRGVVVVALVIVR